MKQLAGYVHQFLFSADKYILLIITLIISVIVYINYNFSLNRFLLEPESLSPRFLRVYLLYSFIFWASYTAVFAVHRKPLPANGLFYCLMLLAPAVFALKTSLRTQDLVDSVHPLAEWNRYLNIVIQWPIKTLLVGVSILLLSRPRGNGQLMHGMARTPGGLTPYFLVLLVFTPVLLLAGSSASFQEVYPKLQLIDFLITTGPSKTLSALFFELCYGIDFFTIEIFFRGFLVLAFLKFAGPDAILPAAAFYCAIHFGKPPLECAGSYFGGIVLGAVVLRTGSIWGGLVIHLGIAWLMELIGLLR